jgi:hypothetical protein
MSDSAAIIFIVIPILFLIQIVRMTGRRARPTDEEESASVRRGREIDTPNGIYSPRARFWKGRRATAG